MAIEVPIPRGPYKRYTGEYKEAYFIPSGIPIRGIERASLASALSTRLVVLVAHNPALVCVDRAWVFQGSLFQGPKG
jgi:hypothetical protein